MGNGQAGIRISYAERDEAVSALGVHLSTGRLELAAQTQPYTIAIHLFRRNPNGPETLMIRGHTRGDTVTEFRPWRRIYPYMVEFARVGGATCRHDPKVS